MSTKAEDIRWSSYFDTKEDMKLPGGDSFRVYHAGNQGPHIILIHGGGFSSLTWCLTTKLLKESCQVHTFDLRGHGSTITCDESDLSIQTLVDDSMHIISSIIPGDSNSTIIVGHSLGGAVAVHVAASNQIKSLVGLVVIDVVEGTALASLEHMHLILQRRPSHFASEEEAIEWSLRSGSIRNSEAAELSIPSQLRRGADGFLTWRTNLSASAEFWKGWFLGLSETFLGVSVPKLLVLAGSDRLDTALTRGQMQGKYQLCLLYGSGHVIQEDCPEKIAEALLDFTARVTSGNVKKDILAEKLARARAMIPK